MVRYLKTVKTPWNIQYFLKERNRGADLRILRKNVRQHQQQRGNRATHEKPLISMEGVQMSRMIFLIFLSIFWRGFTKCLTALDVLWVATILVFNGYPGVG